MAKPQRKKRPSWFQKQITANGQDFLIRKTPQDIQRDYLNICRDIIRGNITNNDYQYLFQLKILENVRFAIFNEYINIHTYYSAMCVSVSDPNLTNILSKNYHVDPDNFNKVYNLTLGKLNLYVELLKAFDTMISFIMAPVEKTEEDYDQVFKTLEYQLSKYKYKL